jgi:hypothetical protein
MNTRSSLKTISSAYPLNILKLVAEIILLMGIGAIGVLLHAKFRSPFITGHYGFIYMALLVAGKQISNRSYAASLSSIGAAFMLLAPLGFKQPLMPLYYLLPGIILDLGFSMGKVWRTNLFLIALICGLAFMTIPMSRIILSFISGLPDNAFVKWGFWGAAGFHLLFGFAGGLAGSSLVKVFIRRHRE